MSDLVYINRRFVDGGERIDKPYVYQYIRTDGHKPLNLAEHLRRLDEVSWQVRGQGAQLPQREVADAVMRLLERNNYAAGEASHIVALRAYTDGSHSLHCCGTSLYRRLSLRALQPTALVVEAYAPLYNMPTSASEAQSAMLREYAKTHGSGAFVATDMDGRLLSVDGATPIAVRNREILVGSSNLSVEERIFLETAERNRRKVFFAELNREELYLYDELCCVDHRGVTAIGCCEGTQYGDIIINAVSERL